jgi:serine/threonine-protein kinase
MRPGARLGHYEVLSALGAGGMGVVYRARDTRLRREVAIKVLPEQVAQDSERLSRFEREALVLASLNHANVATVHGFESAEGTPFLVMELVDGETLADRVARGPVPLDETIALFLQIAEGLEAAHEKGVVHRDLKPANIKISGAGKVKILDFGLAKAMASDRAASAQASASDSPTLTLAATMRGEILGTAAYMSPEQAKGGAVDRRTDLWAFGACLFECLTGRRVFAGNDAAETLAAVLREEPRWGELPRDLPPALLRLLRRCLVRDRRERLQHIGDARLELEEALAESAMARPASEPEARAKPRSRILRWVIVPLAGSVLAALVGLAAWTLKPEPHRPLVRSVVSGSPSAAAVPPQFGTGLAITPDGRGVVYRAGGSLYLRRVDRLVGEPLPGTEGALTPFVSPDGAWVGFWAGNSLRKVNLTGGTSLMVCPAPELVMSATWSDGGTIFFTVLGGGLFRVPARGGDPVLLAEPDREAGERSLSSPQVLPGGRALLLAVQTGDAVEPWKVAVLDLETRQKKILLRAGVPAVYAPTGHLVYAVAGGLRAMAFDPVAHEVRGDSVSVLDGMLIQQQHGVSEFALSREGSLVYFSGTSPFSQSTLVWVDRQGREEPLGAPRAAYAYPAVSPDGTRVVVSDLTTEPPGDIWVWDLRRGLRTRLTRGTALDLFPIWTPDGRDVIYASFDRVWGLFRKAADGTGGEARHLTESSTDLFPMSVSPDGKALVYQSDLKQLYLLDFESGETRPLLAEDFVELNGDLSPDGRFLAYQSNESGRAEVYVRPFPEVESAQWLLSTDGGEWPLWSPAGGELFYRAGDRTMAVPVSTEPTFEAGVPQQLFAGTYVWRGSRMYDVFPDGRRFLMIKEPTGGEAGLHPPQVVLVQNWFQELERLVPTD